MQGRTLGSLVRVRTSNPLVALTFDDGPDPISTPAVLDVLARHGALATFFMIGERAAAHPELVREVAGRGHVVGNHTWNHPRLPDLPHHRRRKQLEACAAALEPYAIPLFRPPYTLQSYGSFLTTRSLGYEVVAWNVQVEDWRDDDEDRLSARLFERIRPGSIVVLHDALWNAEPARADRTALVRALDRLLERRSTDFRFVTVPTLIASGRPVRSPWFVRRDAEWQTRTRSERA